MVGMVSRPLQNDLKNIMLFISYYLLRTEVPEQRKLDTQGIIDWKIFFAYSVYYTVYV